MLIYLAAQYRRRAELCRYRDALEAAGHTVTSRWLHGTDDVEDNGSDPLAHEAATIRFAQDDKTDVARAQLLIAFTEPPRSAAPRGGMFVELGMALAWNKQVYIVGPRQNVFCHLPEVRQFDTWTQCLAALQPEGVPRVSLIHRLRYWLLERYYTWRWLRVHQPQRYTDGAITAWLGALRREER